MWARIADALRIDADAATTLRKPAIWKAAARWVNSSGASGVGMAVAHADR
jgi:hypothetical protein